MVVFLITNEIIAPIWESKGNFNTVLKLDLSNDTLCVNYYIIIKGFISMLNFLEAAQKYYNCLK